MTLLEFKQQFFKELRDSYPKAEIQSFFNLLATYYLNMSRADIALNVHMSIPKTELLLLRSGLNKLMDHQPIQYILKESWFYDFKLKVTPSTLIPRPETEELVSWALDSLDKNSKLRVLDIGTGSGCIAIALARNLPNATIFALDNSLEAIKVAKENAELNNVDISFLHHDIFIDEKLPGNLDLIISNPPYVLQSEKESMRPNVLYFEPHSALFVQDSDPLVFYRRIAALSLDLLGKNGKVFVEINQAKGNETRELFEKNRFHVSLRKDIFKVERMLCASI